MRSIELLSPARDAACGIEAIRHGADAVYIGGPDYGARSAAANSIDDIHRLCDTAHVFGARVYVALNTILYDDELDDVRRTIEALYRAGVDALITQDLALLAMDLPPIPLHASTQMDNRTPEKAQWLKQMGFQQIVLARELSLEQIAAIHRVVTTPLEAFVHGALCVSYSGQCYASQHCFQRSANRGCCSQFCRLPFDLIDSEGQVLARDKHLLSLRDMKRIDYLEAMMDAGISSFKIEGRLKDITYVKNVTAAYRQAIDAILQRRSKDYCRSSYGTSDYTFTPDLSRSFNRGYTDYFLLGRRSTQLQNIYTPKAMGAFLGRVVKATATTIDVAIAPHVPPAAAGDGLCYLDLQGKLRGFRVNKAEDTRLFLNTEINTTEPVAPPGALLYRNHDQAFTRLLAGNSATRLLALDIDLQETPAGYTLTLHCETGKSVRCNFNAEHVTARTPQEGQMSRVLGKLGDTPYKARRITFTGGHGDRFIPASLLTTWRREAISRLDAASKVLRPSVHDIENPLRHKADSTALVQSWSLECPPTYANALARRVLMAQGLPHPDINYELAPRPEALLMTCRYCLRYALDRCPRQAKSNKTETSHHPWFLRLADGRRFRLVFDCKNCLMKIYATT